MTSADSPRSGPAPGWTTSVLGKEFHTKISKMAIVGETSLGEVDGQDRRTVLTPARSAISGGRPGVERLRTP